MNVESSKALFPRATEVAYLDTSAEGLPVPGCAEAFQQYFRDKSQGTPGRKALHRVEAETIALVAELLATDPENVTFLANASDAFNLLANSLEWHAGDEIIISDLEFPSNVLPWLRLQQRGVRVVLISAVAGAMTWQRVTAHITARTRLISLSLVSYWSGAYLPDVPRIAEAARRVGAILSIDATQAFGRCPVSLEGVDFLMSSSFKWLLGPHGLGIVYISPSFRDRLANPASIGWYSVGNVFSADRFERYDLKPGARCLAAGMPNFLSIYGLRASLSFLRDIGIHRIFENLRPVVDQLRRGCSTLGCDMLTPAEEQFASGVVAFRHPRADRIGAALAQRNIVVWGGDNRVRASVHLYNDTGDVTRFLEALEAVLALPEIGRE